MTFASDRPWVSITDPRYFARLIQNTRHLYPHMRRRALIRFSLSSDPHAPDFRVVGPDGYTLECAGRNGVEPNFSSLSREEFTVDDIWRMYRSAKSLLTTSRPTGKSYINATGGNMNDADRPWEGVDNPSYFRSVMKNMEKLGFGLKAEGSAHVRFGRTGEGVAPNYQIEGPNSDKTLFNGLGHREITHVEDEFDPEKISEKFTFKQVQEMLARILPPGHKYGAKGDKADDEVKGDDHR